jgi:hypothetical protein
MAVRRIFLKVRMWGYGCVGDGESGGGGFGENGGGGYGGTVSHGGTGERRRTEAIRCTAETGCPMVIVWISHYCERGWPLVTRAARAVSSVAEVGMRRCSSVDLSVAQRCRKCDSDPANVRFTGIRGLHSVRRIGSI